MNNLILGFVRPRLAQMSHGGTNGRRILTMVRFARTVFCALTVGLTFGSGDARGGVISAGYDLFATDPGTTFVTIDNQPVLLRGVPFIPNTDVDTIVERIGSPIPAGAMGTFQIRLDELYLKSLAPRDYAGIGMADVYVTRNFMPSVIPGIPQPDPLPAPPLGTLKVLTHNEGLGAAGGGTFSSNLPVNVDLIFTKVGGNPNNPSDVLAHRPLDASFVQPPPSQPPGQWSHTPRFDDAHSSAPAPFSQAGNFYAGVNPSTPGLEKVLTREEAMGAMHGVLPAQANSDRVIILPPNNQLPLIFTFPERAASDESKFGFFTSVVPATAFLLAHPSITVNFMDPLVPGFPPTLSDTLVMSATPILNNQQIILSFSFISDPPESGLGFPPPGSIVEDGLPIDVTTLLFGVGADNAPFQVLVQSDIEPIPEPSALVLIGMGLSGLLGYAWRRSMPGPPRSREAIE